MLPENHHHFGYISTIRTIQVRAGYVPGISEQTKNLQRERKFAQEKAAFTNDPED